MEIRTFTLENKNGFTFNITYYQISPITKKKQRNPLIIIFAGGGFTSLSKREQEPIALKYLSEGFHVALVHYNLLTQELPLFPNAALCGLVAIEHFRSYSQKYSIDSQKIITAGFSAGGSVAAAINSFINDQNLLTQYDLDRKKVRPNGTILGYPLLELESLQTAYPVDFQQWVPTEPVFINANLGVGTFTPPTFLFHTADDPLVPVSNTLHYAQSLNEQHIPFEVHIFSSGVHGLSTARAISATERPGEVNPAVATWMSLSLTWLHSIL